MTHTHNSILIHCLNRNEMEQTFVNLEFHVIRSGAEVSDDEFVFVICADVSQRDALREGVDGGHWVVMRIQPLTVTLMTKHNKNNNNIPFQQ